MVFGRPFVLHHLNLIRGEVFFGLILNVRKGLQTIAILTK